MVHQPLALNNELGLRGGREEGPILGADRGSEADSLEDVLGVLAFLECGLTNDDFWIFCPGLVRISILSLGVSLFRLVDLGCSDLDGPFSGDEEYLGAPTGFDSSSNRALGDGAIFDKAAASVPR